MTVSNDPSNAACAMNGGPRVRLYRALGLSLLGHLLVLFGLQPSGPPADRVTSGHAAPPLAAVLRAPHAATDGHMPPAAGREPGAATPVPQPEATRQPQQTPKRPAQTPEQQPAQARTSEVLHAPVRASEVPPLVPIPELQRLRASAESGGAAGAPAASAMADGQSIAAAPGNVAATVGVAAPAAATGSAAGQPGTVEASLLAAYRQALVQAALGYKRYPPLARERGWEGTVELTVVLLPRHPAPVLRVSRGSGVALLDDQALEMMSRAVRRLPVPEALQSARAQLIVPIRFRLDD